MSSTYYNGFTTMFCASSFLKAIIEPLILNAIGLPDGLNLSTETMEFGISPKSRNRLLDIPLFNIF